MATQPRLIEIDLSKIDRRGRNTEGGVGIRVGVQYLAQYGGRLAVVEFNEVWFGLSSPSMGFHAQYDPPGENCSQWERLWELDMVEV